MNFSFMNPCAGFPDRAACVGDHNLFTSMDRTINVFAVFVFAFTCQQNIFSIVNEIKDHTQSKVNKVVLLSIMSAMVINLAVSLTGYYTYGEQVKANILENLPVNVMVTTARIFVAVLMLFTYPLQLHPVSINCTFFCVIGIPHFFLFSQGNAF